MKKIVLINISGEDRPGITSMVTGILAAHGINVLDIGQAVIHSHLALGLLVEIPEERETSGALKELLFHAHEAGLQLRYTAVSAGSYREWVAGQGKPRHIVTLLSRRIRGEEIARLTEIVARHGLNIDKITRLSGRESLHAAADGDRACALGASYGGYMINWIAGAWSSRCAATSPTPRRCAATSWSSPASSTSTSPTRKTTCSAARGGWSPSTWTRR